MGSKPFIMSGKNYFYWLFLFLLPGIFKIPEIKAGKRLLLFLSLLISINSQVAFSQIKRIVAIGSSTTAGVGATSPDSGWVCLLNQYYKCRLGIIDSAYNLGVAGTDNYYAMPTGYVSPPARPAPDTAHNVSKACFILSDLSSAAHGVVIVNFPTNDYNTFSIAEIMSSLQTIYDYATKAGHPCFISTTQPRGDDNFNTPAVKRKLADIKDSIISRFGTAHTLNFWDGMFNPADSTILAKYSSSDLVHFNNAGHRVLYERVITKNIFGLPVWYSKPNGNLDGLATWGSNTDGSGSSPESFATDNQVFNVVNNTQPTIGANWILSGKNIQLIIGDGILPIDFIVPPGLTISITSPVINSCY